MAAQKIYEVSDVVKLSIHRNGFVQFSKGGSKPIVSGFNEDLKQPKGAGLHAPDPVSVSTGPICGVVLQGLEGFRQHRGEFAEVFTREDLWYHPEFSKQDSSAYNLEIFMLSRALARRAVLKNDRLILSHELPFYSRFQFAFDLRVIDLPHQPFALGLILSPMMRDESTTSGYKLGGPGCRDVDTGDFKSIFAMYPKHPELAKLASQSLDYQIED